MCLSSLILFCSTIYLLGYAIDMCYLYCFCFFFFKQKTAYEMRISDWSSDVCSSDLGNDQVRFELTYYALAPDIKVIAPWREWEFKSRSDLIAFAEQHQIPVAKDKRGEAPFSVDANLLHSSSEGKVLEDPGAEPPPYVYQRTIAPTQGERRVGK